MMSTDVRVPTTGNAGEEAVIVEWNVAVGATVSKGDVLVILETAKATIDVEAPEDGEVLGILFEPGDEVPEHEILAVIGAPGEQVKAGGDAVAAPAATPGAEAVPRTEPASEASEAQASVPASPAAPAGQAAPASIKASPRAAILAGRNDVDLSTVTGTGPGGRIIVADVIAARAAQQSAPAAATTAAASSTAAYAASAPATSAPASSPAASVPGVDPYAYDSFPVRGARKVTAQRMHASLQNTAQVTLTRYADVGALLDYSKRLRLVTEAKGLPKIGVNELVLFATAKAVAAHPEANATFEWDEIRRYRSVNLGFAVDTGAALLVPVIPAADQLSLGQLAAATRASIDKSRSGKLSTPEMEGGTFTVSNLGSLGVHWFTPVLNPPQACILGVGATHQTHPEGPRLLPLSLTFDHRCLDGAAAAALLADIAESLSTVDVLSAL